jgi:neutral trehalase
LLQFLKSSDDYSRLGSLRGSLFEGFAHNLLRRGGKFVVRNLRTKKVSQLVLQATEAKYYRLLNEVELAKPFYYQPVSHNEAAIDALTGPNLMFQMTVDDKHNINMAGLQKAVEQMAPGTVPKLYFVVPEDKFRQIGWQSYVTSGGTVATKLPRDVERVEQWTLSVPLSSSS